jgi:hypothetical protein
MAAGLGFKEFTTGDVLTAADANGYLASQVVMVFADAADRTADLTSPEEGMISYLKDTNAVEKYDGAAWVSVGAASASGLTLVKTQTIGSAVSSITVTDAFSSTYDNYMITISGGVGSASGSLALKMGTTATGYFMTNIYMQTQVGATITGENSANRSDFGNVASYDTSSIQGEVLLFAPNLAKPTVVNANNWRAVNDKVFQTLKGSETSSTQHTAFTLTCSTGNVTGGTIRVYGYQNS